MTAAATAAAGPAPPIAARPLFASPASDPRGNFRAEFPDTPLRGGGRKNSRHQPRVRVAGAGRDANRVRNGVRA